jgi:hypothetical protein
MFRPQIRFLDHCYKATDVKVQYRTSSVNSQMRIQSDDENGWWNQFCALSPRSTRDAIVEDEDEMEIQIQHEEPPPSTADTDEQCPDDEAPVPVVRTVDEYSEKKKKK